MSEDAFPYLRPPEESAAQDVSIAIAKGLLGIVPFVGSPVAEMVDLLMRSPTQKRMHAFLVDVCNAIEQLRLRGELDYSRLLEDDSFSATVYQVVQAVNRTADGEKLAALRRAVLNSAQPSDLTAAMRQRFIQAVDEFSVDHLRRLKEIAQFGANTYCPKPRNIGHSLDSPLGIERPTSAPTAFPTRTRSLSPSSPPSSSASWEMVLNNDLLQFGFVAKRQRDATRLSVIGRARAGELHWSWSITAFGKSFLDFIDMSEGDEPTAE